MRLPRPARSLTAMPRALATIAVIGAAGGISSVALHSPVNAHPRHHGGHAASSSANPPPAPGPTPTSGAPNATVSQQVPTTGPGGLPPAGPGFVPGQVTALGDSVMVDAEAPLQADIAGVQVDAAVSRQWADGEQVLRQRKAAGQLGAVVVVNLGTNGPITTTDFDTMMSVLSGASRVVFVTVHVGQPWQDQVNSVLAYGVARYQDTVLADWQSLAAQHPEWFGPDGTHMAIGGPGAQAYASLIAGKV